jgi:hypothetical protein
MHPIPNFDAHNMFTQDTFESGKPQSSSYKLFDNMSSGAQYADKSSTMSSGTTTPISDRSSVSNDSSVSSISTTYRPNRSTIKSSLKSTSCTQVYNRRSSPQSVRFSESEPVLRHNSTTWKRQQQKKLPQCNSIMNPLHQYQRQTSRSVSSQALSRSSVGPRAYSTLPPHNPPAPLPEHIQYQKSRASQRFSAATQSSQLDQRRSVVQPLANFTPPSLTLEHRVSSFASNFSVQSAPAALQTSSATSPTGQYNPLEHYVPCLHATCTINFSPTIHGPVYRIPQGPYSLLSHCGYCPHHASKELKEANAYCKSNWESLRQNAGRKTLGQIATEFDIFLDVFRNTRRLQDEDLQKRQKRIVLGTWPIGQNKDKQDDDTEWNWIYAPRHCTRSSCQSTPFSPFANHLYAFYHTRRSLSFTALPTLCPTCATDEVEAFERMVAEKWASRCGWDESAWKEWFDKAVKDREMERAFWETAQEREVTERRLAMCVDGKTVKQGKEETSARENKKKSVFKRLFRTAAKGR